ncbi:MAG TPA: TraB/GumN family protein [Rhizomicrobium sp.]|nr:TraB/GumN family protein [Rhizomicrobium sp.]
MIFRRFFFPILLALLFVGPAAADTIARPSLWHVQGSQGDMYLLGSVHILPPDVKWRTPEITAALARADVFVFEVPQDEKSLTQIQALMTAKGYLPPDQDLRSLLHPEARADFDAALAASGLPASAVARSRPWLAGLQMMFAQIARKNFALDNGVDNRLMAEADKAKKPVRFLETIEQQFALLAPEDRALELEEFEASLKDLRDITAEVQPMVDAWSAGDQKTLDALINGDLDRYPAARKALLDDRNKAWLPKLRAMLQEKGTFFVTVGAGHLTGPTGLPALLRRAGYAVDGP